uniref:1-deoxy-D-xylulose-5-phosphate synthase n=1 Tax=Rhabditophanes sp. KR3021 TaxID=114890 RepID=A0AC35U4C4_9BILA
MESIYYYPALQEHPAAPAVEEQLAGFEIEEVSDVAAVREVLDAAIPGIRLIEEVQQTKKWAKYWLPKQGKSPQTRNSLNS